MRLSKNFREAHIKRSAAPDQGVGIYAYFMKARKVKSSKRDKKGSVHIQVMVKDSDGWK